MLPEGFTPAAWHIGGSSEVMKRLLLAGMLWFAPVPGVDVSAHESAIPGAPAAVNKRVAPAPAIVAPAGPHAGHAMAPSPSAAPPLPMDDAAQESAVSADDEPGSEHAPGMIMRHPGLPESWILATALAMAAIALWTLVAPRPTDAPDRSVNLANVPVVGRFVRFLTRSPYPLLAGKLVAVALFLLVVAAGLFGTPFPERNLATALVWNVWWPLVVVSVLFLGTAWCAVCPWDALSGWIVRRRWWRRASPHPGLNLKVPGYLHNVWLALLLFIGLTWLEIGLGVTAKPFATALMALAMLVMSVVFLVVFERKAFCRYACPVGRTLGFYARLASVAASAGPGSRRRVAFPTNRCSRCSLSPRCRWRLLIIWRTTWTI